MTQELCNEAVQRAPWTLEHVSDQYKTQEICNKAVQGDPWTLEHVSDQCETQELCNEALQRDPEVPEYIPDWFVTLKKMWYEEFDDDDENIMWRDAYIKRKAQKAKIKEKLMPAAWHPDRWWNWCVTEDEKKELEIFCTLCPSGS